MGNISLQVERTVAGSIAANDTVVFDATLISSGNIAYNSATGVVTLFEAGRYEFDWWVSTQSAASNNVSFVLASSQGGFHCRKFPPQNGRGRGGGYY